MLGIHKLRSAGIDVSQLHTVCASVRAIAHSAARPQCRPGLDSTHLDHVRKVREKQGQLRLRQFVQNTAQELARHWRGDICQHSYLATFIIQSSTLDFYRHSQPIRQCSKHLTRITPGLFSLGFIINLYLASHNKFGKQPICPFVFYQANFTQLVFQSTSDNFLMANAPRFNADTETASFDLEITIYWMSASIYLTRLDRNYLNEQVFSNVQSLSFDGLINSVDQRLLRSFFKLRIISFSFADFRRLASTNKCFYLDSII